MTQPLFMKINHPVSIYGLKFYKAGVAGLSVDLTAGDNNNIAGGNKSRFFCHSHGMVKQHVRRLEFLAHGGYDSP